MKDVAVLLSRQPLRPTGSAPWIRAVAAAADRIKRHGLHWLTSVGMSTWEFQVAYAGLNQMKQTVFISAADRNEYEARKKLVAEDFELNPDLTEFKSVIPPHRLSRERLMKTRDEMIVNRADILMPVSIRPKGTMSRLLTSSGRTTKTIDRDFEISYRQRSQPLTYEIDSRRLNLKLHAIGGRYLTHWTRAANKAWPDESSLDYWSDILDSDTYPRSALDTLKYILISGKLIASSRHMPRQMPTVSFSALPPLDVVSLMRWRARYREMSFEPYGLGIEEQYGLRLGLRPVIYYDRLSTDEIADEDMWLTQSRGKKTDWRQEAEYRYPGDLDIGSIPHEHLIAFCYLPDEAAQIEEMFDVRCISVIN